MSNNFSSIILQNTPLKISPEIKNFADIIFNHKLEMRQKIAIYGTVGNELIEITFEELQKIISAVATKIHQMGLQKGDTVSVIRLPQTSETLVAINYLALSVLGIRVFYPMYLDADSLFEWFERTKTSAIFYNPQEIKESENSDVDIHYVKKIKTIIKRYQDQYAARVYTYSSLGLDRIIRDAKSYEVNWGLINEAKEEVTREDEAIIMTTSGTSGKAKLVVYNQNGFINSCESWESAGFYKEGKMQGTGLCLLLGHSMGIRALWNAMWSKDAICILPPEWFLTKPEYVQSYLTKISPQHITGGPGVYRTILELARVFPIFKQNCLSTLKCGVFSGAAIDLKLSEQIKSVFNLRVENAFGMTETMQVISTMVDGKLNNTCAALGNPLPGVKLAFKKIDNFKEEVFKMYVDTPFGFKGYLEKDGVIGQQDGYFDTGDLVTFANNEIRYYGREKYDFLNDSMGVKISKKRLNDLYKLIIDDVDWVEFFPIEENPGLGMIIFTGDDQKENEIEIDKKSLDKYKNLLYVILEEQKQHLEEFEFRHCFVERFCVVNKSVPRTKKGTVLLNAIEEKYFHLIKKLTAFYHKSEEIVYVDPRDYYFSSMARLSLPRIGKMMTLLKIDKNYIEGCGDHIFYEENGNKHKVLDLVGGFGGNILGHNHPYLLDKIKEFYAKGNISLFDQGSSRKYTNEFVKKLVSLISSNTKKSFVCKLGSTGSEAVEMALAHAYIELEEKFNQLKRDQKRLFGGSYPKEVEEVINSIEKVQKIFVPKVIALKGAFHGNSLAARSVLSNKEKRSISDKLSRIETIFLDIEKENASDIVDREKIIIDILFLKDGKLVKLEVHFSSIIAAIVEPVQGEGGVRVINNEYLESLSKFDFPLIIDEIQAGLGRTGNILASSGISGDYYLFAKALGGGIAKLSALLIDKKRYVGRFDELYSSTFSGDAFSSYIGLNTLDLIINEDIPKKVQKIGKIVKERLQKIQHLYPEFIADVTGEGLFLGIKLETEQWQSNGIMRVLFGLEAYGLLISSYILNIHNVRMLPTLSAPNILRIQPSAYVSENDLGMLFDALISVGEILKKKEIARLFSSMLFENEDLISNQSDYENVKVSNYFTGVEVPAPGAKRIAFINHFVFPEDELVMLEPSFRIFKKTTIRKIFNSFMELNELKPFVSFAKNIFNEQIYFVSIVLSADASTLENLHKRGYYYLETERVQKAVDMAKEMGCEIVSLGGYSSIITKDGLSILPPKKVDKWLDSNTPKAVILSGSNWSVYDKGAPELPKLLDTTGKKYFILGICYGMQLAVIEYARNVLAMKDAHTTEVNPASSFPVIDILPEQKEKLLRKEYGNSMRLGTYKANLKEKTLFSSRRRHTR